MLILLTHWRTEPLKRQFIEIGRRGLTWNKYYKIIYKFPILYYEQVFYSGGTLVLQSVFRAAATVIHKLTHNFEIFKNSGIETKRPTKSKAFFAVKVGLKIKKACSESMKAIYLWNFREIQRTY